jgi:hypothetical protein
MSTDMTFSSSVIASDDIFCDDIFVKPTGKTLRKIYNVNYVADPEMYCNRDVNGTFVPTTDADVSLKLRDVCLNTNATPTNSRNSFSFYGKSISLRNHGLFNTVFDELEKHCISKKVTSNMRSGNDVTEYVLPVAGHFDSATLYQEDIYKPVACPKKQYVKQKTQQQTRRRKFRSWKYYEAQKTKADKSRYIRINGNMYSVNNVYKRSGTDFVPVVIHKESDEPILNEHNQSVRNRRSVGTAITISFIKDTNLTGFVLEPEPMKFEYIYEDVDTRRSQRRGRGFIKCLVNDPGFITKFEVLYRSTLTDGQWVKYNIFDGNDNNHTPTKIVFDEEIVAKEIRIIPLTYINSFEKVGVAPFTTIIPEEKKDENETVTYYIETTNRPSSIYTYAPDVLCWGSSYWRRHNYKKGDNKIKQREFRELCDL